MTESQLTFEQYYSPERYYRVAAENLKKLILDTAKTYKEQGWQGAWASLQLVDVTGIPDVGILVFFRLPHTGERVHVYVADLTSLADIERSRQARADLAPGQAPRPPPGLQGYDVFDDDLVFSLNTPPGVTPDEVAVIHPQQFFALAQRQAGGPLQNAAWQP